jgi:hypothetical protein
MPRFGTFLIVLAVSGAIAYAVAHRNDPRLRSLAVPSISVDELLERGRDYDGKTVKVNGIVVHSLGLLGIGEFVLQDASSGTRIMVMASSGIPRDGTVASVTGTFKRVVAIGSFQYAVILQHL